jgi:hypothetical protein
LFHRKKKSAFTLWPPFYFIVHSSLQTSLSLLNHAKWHFLILFCKLKVYNYHGYQKALVAAAGPSWAMNGLALPVAIFFQPIMVF